MKSGFIVQSGLLVAILVAPSPAKNKQRGVEPSLWCKLLLIYSKWHVLSYAGIQ